MANPVLQVEVVYALPEQQLVIPMTVPAGITVGEAIECSGILLQLPTIDLARQAVGIWGECCILERLVAQGDRIEIYRPLCQDPKAKRRLRACSG